MWNMQMTYRDYYRSLASLTELELEYAAGKCPRDCSIAQTVNELTDLYSFSTCFQPQIKATENSQWITILQKLTGNPHNDCKVLLADFALRMQADLLKAKKEIAQSHAGFMFEYHPEYFKPADSKAFLTLHFRNYFAPESPFRHLGKLAAGLFHLAEEVSLQRPGVTDVQCASWLNNIPAFLMLFPEEWQKNMTVCPYQASTGWWGQFIDRKGAVNIEKARQFRQNLEFPFSNLHGICKINNLLLHLQNFVTTP